MELKVIVRPHMLYISHYELEIEVVYAGRKYVKREAVFPTELVSLFDAIFFSAQRTLKEALPHFEAKDLEPGWIEKEN